MQIKHFAISLILAAVIHAFHLGLIYLLQMNYLVYPRYVGSEVAHIQPYTNEEFRRSSIGRLHGWTIYETSYYNYATNIERTNLRVLWGWPVHSIEGGSEKLVYRNFNVALQPAKDDIPVAFYENAVPCSRPKWSVSSIDFVPYGVVWHGLLINMLIMTSVSWGLIATVKKIVFEYRKRKTLKRCIMKQCLVCGYQINGLRCRNCPECGSILETSAD